MMRTGTSVAVLIGFALALGGCGSSSLFSSSPLDMFKSSPKATAGTGGVDGKGTDSDVDCPDVQVRTGASTLMIGSKPDEQGEPAALDLRYQATVIRTARECHLNAGLMTMKVGIEGRVITGPAGAPGAIDVPLRIVVVQEGITPKTVVSKFARIPVTISSAIDRVIFTHVQDDIAFPVPPVAADLEAYVVYVGFDAMAAQPEKPKPAPKKSKAKPKGVANPKQS
ncbi:MAG TPA: hypothetical protein VGC38_04745 [Pseudolabrys sp.]